MEARAVNVDPAQANAAPRQPWNAYRMWCALSTAIERQLNATNASVAMVTISNLGLNEFEDDNVAMVIFRGFKRIWSDWGMLKSSYSGGNRMHDYSFPRMRGTVPFHVDAQ